MSSFSSAITALVLVVLLFSSSKILAQHCSDCFEDTLITEPVYYSSCCPITYKQFIIPSTLFGIGLIGLENKQIKRINTELRTFVNKNFDGSIHVDDYTQFAPTATILMMHAFGKKGVNKTTDVIFINLLSLGIMESIVKPLKETTNCLRPDNQANNSFPSGHTATSFVNAEMLWREYHQSDPWLGYAGYGVATFTGLCRVRNNRHWISDVVAGAGIGMLSTKLAYCLYPKVRRLFKRQPSFVCMPKYNTNYKGATISYHF